MGVKSSDPEAGENHLLSLLQQGVVSVPFSDAVAAGTIRAALERNKVPIRPYDIPIASQAVARGLILATANVREFNRVEGLLWSDWMEGN